MIFICTHSPQRTDHNSKYCIFEKICDTPGVTCRGSVADPDLELRRVEGGGGFVACPAGFSSFCDS